MDAVLRAAAIYLFLLVVMRLSGRRTLGQMTPFDLVLLLVLGETTQQALLSEDFSLTNSMILILTLVTIDIAFSLAKGRFASLARVLDGAPTILVENGQPLLEQMRRARVDESDILEAARRLRGLARMDQIRYAVLEQSGDLSIVPVRETDRSGD